MIDGKEEDIKNLSLALNTLKEKAGFEFEFLIGTERIQLYDVNYLLEHLIALYKDYKKENKKRKKIIDEMSKLKGELDEKENRVS
ncbi:hypothetical protein [Oceanihabitans sediminis]|uniref:hypothetical protein n=1 Tax=Oceanihabitans sediminis TaxID=1812012 RepID=UPI00299EB301|nr:hypothetical protein [Oceanihabitans sediminis]MDX1279518.1 hypothetical protein [Oceanihabitans sediminis]